MIGIRDLRMYESWELGKDGYPVAWKEIAGFVKDEARWCCLRCGRPHDVESGYVLTVHHLDGNPANCRWWNLPALCQRCHLSIQARVVMVQDYFLDHSEWFKIFAAGWYAFTKAGLDLTRAQTFDRMDEFLSLGRGPGMVVSDIEIE